MTDRVDLLEERVAALATAVAALEARLAGLERAAGAVAQGREERGRGWPRRGPRPRPASPDSPRSRAAAPTALAGRAFLGIGGAYLFRALTEAGTLPHLVGVALGLAYAGAWALRGGVERPIRAAASGRHASRVPVPRRGAPAPLGDDGADAGLAARSRRPRSSSAIGAAVFAVAWRHDLASVAWAATLGAVGTAWGLLLATARIELFTLLLIAFGAATLWATYGRRWHGLRWPAALAADLAVLTLVYLGSRPGGPPEAYAGLSAGRSVLRRSPPLRRLRRELRGANARPAAGRERLRGLPDGSRPRRRVRRGGPPLARGRNGRGHPRRGGARPLRARLRCGVRLRSARCGRRPELPLLLVARSRPRADRRGAARLRTVARVRVDPVRARRGRPRGEVRSAFPRWRTVRSISSPRASRPGSSRTPSRLSRVPTERLPLGWAPRRPRWCSSPRSPGS